MTEWQKIEDAPEYLSEVLFIYSCDRMYTGFFTRGEAWLDCHVSLDGSKGGGLSSDADKYGKYPTHWMPLPLPPEGDKDD